MTTDLTGKSVLILSDHDALYAAIELKLSSLTEVRVVRLESDSPRRQRHQSPVEDSDLIIVATISRTNDPMSLLSMASLLDQVGEVPVLIISERLSKPESTDKITYLNFPFDMDDLPHTAMKILTQRPQMTAHGPASSRG